MTSFFEKLKKGMGAEAQEEIEEKTEEKEKVAERPRKKKKTLRAKKIEVGEEPPEAKAEEAPAKKPEDGPGASAELGDKSVPRQNEAFGLDKEKWPEPEGQLAIDVYQTETELAIQSAIAGVKPENLDISLEKDVLTIRGNRQKPSGEERDYFTQECYWGPFSREVILPVEVDPGQVEATMKEGILTIRIPKILREKLRKIKVKI